MERTSEEEKVGEKCKVKRREEASPLRSMPASQGAERRGEEVKGNAGLG
jgi:hypothetical protein